MNSFLEETHIHLIKTHKFDEKRIQVHGRRGNSQARSSIVKKLIFFPELNLNLALGKSGGSFLHDMNTIPRSKVLHNMNTISC